ncbi:myrosinase 1-like [Teleopsis dalmanni]|uniref:myrosinase 1-like n=1 Tax=Teleopsis dalmanni TaxID=139649 RepID=UPI0018CDBC8E|nr:myrosinase 1-like [Teleopsis dalmanni]
MKKYSYHLLLVVAFCFLHTRSVTAINAQKICELKHKIGSEKFPSNFSFGVSTAAYQIEGAWNEDGKGLSIWDTFTHDHPEMIDDRSNGDIGPDSYHRFEQDLAALKELKVNFYRFSISWPRILPNGDISSKNQKGIDYYNMVINKLISNGIEPMVTMIHYDLPQALSDLGGFTNEIFIKYFRYYADTLYENFGDRVKVWVTFNEPFDYCVPGYGSGNFPPMVRAPGVADYMCMETTLKAHAAAYRLYKAKYFETQGGKVGITISSRFLYPKTNDNDAVDRGMQYSLGWLAHPIFSLSGNYPYIMIEDIVSNSQKEGRAWPRLSALKSWWLNAIKGSGDFLGLNYYSSRYVEEALPPKGVVPSWDHDAHLKYDIDSKWRRAKSTWLYCVPEGLEDLLKWIRDNYNNVEVIITENGWSDEGTLDDSERIDYLKAHLQAVLNAVNSGCNVSRYTHWSLIDNFEWQRGYTEKFGLYYVNLTSENKERIPKRSAIYYKRVIETKTVIDN